ELPFDPNRLALEDYSIFDFSRDDEDDGEEADMNNLDTTIQVSPILTTRIYKDHPLEQDPSWIDAMQEELLQFKLQEVWTLVDLPNRNMAIGTKWVFRNKKDERGIMIRNKARLVAQGYTQEEGIDYDEIGEEVYVCQPPGFEDPDFPDKVYKVEKALYRLYQAPRAWYETLSTYMLDNRFQRGKIDKTLFIKRHKGDILLVQVYVDDIIFGSTKKELCIAFEKLMHEKFQMSSMGELTFFLGLQVKQKKDGIFISQDKYVEEILKKFGFTEVKTASTPMETQKPLLKDEDGEEVDVHMYRSMIGSLMYLTSSRPDIMFAVYACARYQVNPKVSHLHVVKRIFRYLKGQPKLGLWYPKDSPFDLVAYTDSDYARASLDKKSTTGEAEYMAASSFRGQTHQISDGFEQIVDFLNAQPIRYALTVNPTIYISCIEQFWSTGVVKTINGEVQLHALVDGKKIIISEASVRRDLKLEDEEDIWKYKKGRQRFSGRVTPLFPTMVVQNQQELGEGSAIPIDPHHTPMFIQLSTQPQKTQKPRKPKRKDTQVPQPSDPTENVTDEAVHKELGDSLVRAATTASSLEAEWSKKPWDNIAQLRVLDLEKTKTTQANEIASLKRRVNKLEKKDRSRTHKLKRLYKVGLTTSVESSGDEEDLGEDASKQGRRVNAIDVDEDITLVNVQDDVDNEMFDVNVLNGEEVFVAGKNENVVEEVVNAAQVSIAATIVTITTEEITLAQALKALKTSKPKDKGKGIMIEEPVKPMKKKVQIMVDEEAALKLQAEFNEEERLARKKAEKEKEANIALIEECDDVQEKIDADH
ncbi:putative ribonuclease H-like domain-containing protein, partial [Tanacetum coccineum]